MRDWSDLEPAAEIDLHGQSVLEAIANAERFVRAQRGAFQRRGDLNRT